MSLVALVILIILLSLASVATGCARGYMYGKTDTLDAFQRELSGHICNDACPKHPITIKFRKR